MSTTQAAVGIFAPTPREVRLYPGEGGGLTLQVAEGPMWFCLGDPRFTKDLAEEAAAMRKLAGLATEAAAELERRAGEPS